MTAAAAFNPPKGPKAWSPNATHGERIEEVFFPVPESEDRVEILATCVYTRHTTTDFGERLEGLFICEGELGRFKLWGTVPSSLQDEIDGMNTIHNWTVKGSVVTFWARIERGKKNDYSGFFKLPTKARILVPGVNGKEKR